MMEIAVAQLQRPGKGEDEFLVRSINNTTQLLAVADGLSLNGGKAAALWVIDYLKRVADTNSPRTIFAGLKRELALSRLQVDQSETTLTCGILQQVGTEEFALLRFEYFAIGDSPIWKVVVGDSNYPFQRILVHGQPYPAETARVYSTVRLHEGDIWGTVTFGAVEVEPGEVLVVCTDGIPEREVFIRDFRNPEGAVAGSPGLCRLLFQQPPYSSEDLAEVLANYDHRGVLFDDATIITARLVTLAVSHADSQTAHVIPGACEADSTALAPRLGPDDALPRVEVDTLASGKKMDLLSEYSNPPVLSASETTAQPEVDQSVVTGCQPSSPSETPSAAPVNESSPTAGEAVGLPRQFGLEVAHEACESLGAFGGGGEDVKLAGHHRNCVEGEAVPPLCAAEDAEDAEEAVVEARTEQEQEAPLDGPAGNGDKVRRVG